MLISALMPLSAMKLVTCVFLCLSSLATVLAVDNVELRAAFIVLRHGERAPTDFYPKDPFKDPSYWQPYGIGEMTQKGRDQLDAAGRLYASAYSQLVTTTNGWPSLAYHSPRNRAKETAQIFLESFLKASHGTQLQALLSETGAMLSTATECKKASELWYKHITSKKVSDYTNTYRDFILQLEPKTGDQYLNNPSLTLRKLEFLTTTLEIERDAKLEVPNWAKDPKTIRNLDDLKNHAFLYNHELPEIQRLRCGLLLKNITRNMLELTQEETLQKDRQRIFIYSTHDVNQVLILLALNVYDVLGNKPTDYASSIVFELYHNPNDKSNLVRVIYRKLGLVDSGYEYSDVPLLIPQCKENPKYNLDNGEQVQLCTYTQLIDAVSNLLPDNWERECRSSATKPLVQWLFAFATILVLLVKL